MWWGFRKYPVRHWFWVTLVALLTGPVTQAQPGTEIWLFDLNDQGRLSNPVNVSQNPGYDNQPSFTRGGNRLLYTSTRNGQTDIVSYDIQTQSRSWLTDTPGSEYSPLQVPGTFTFSTILLEEDGRQLLWNYSLNGGEGVIMVPYVKIGYHTWLSDDSLYAFVLGPVPTLQEISLIDQRAEIIQDSIGRSLGIYDGGVVFVDQSRKPYTLSLFQPKTREIKPLIGVPGTSVDFTVSGDGTVYMGDGSKLMSCQIDHLTKWAVIADLTIYGLKDISRLAISPDNRRIAIVTSE